MKQVKDPGFGYRTKVGAASIVNKDGSSNVKHRNKPVQVDDLYAYLIHISWRLFFVLVFLGYVVLNAIFAIVYCLIGIEEITNSTGSFMRDFLNAFFFSAQTITSVGYGGISPNGILAGFISSFEALIGLLAFAFITGLLYGRFSKPKASIRFSDHALIAKGEQYRTLMFRLMNTRKTLMIEPEIDVTLSLATTNEDGEIKRSYYRLELERDAIKYLPTMWTLVHTLDEKSPLNAYSNEELAHLDAELYIIIKYYEESFSQHLYQMFSYSFSEFIFDYKFVTSYEFDKEGTMVLDHQRLNKTIPVNA